MENSALVLNVLKVFGLSALSFFIAISAAPLIINRLYRYKMWVRQRKHIAITGEEASVVKSLRKDEPLTIPRMGGVLIWGSLLLIILLFWALSNIFSDSPLFTKLNFFSRSQTWLPLFTLISASLIGLADDFLHVKGSGGYIAGGLDLKKRIFLVAMLGAVGAWWFYSRLEASSILVPFLGEVELGLFFIPLFIAAMIGTFSGGVIDGIDGLAGGVFAAMFAAYGGVAFFHNQIDLAAFSGVVMGATLAFLWFNIPPARFYMGETGIMGLTTTLTVIAFLTKAVIVLPIIAFPLVLASGSDILQIFSKKIRGRKLFLAAPIHHHFEAKGWPPYKVTMRFWILGTVFAIIGMVIALIG